MEGTPYHTLSLELAEEQGAGLDATAGLLVRLLLEESAVDIVLKLLRFATLHHNQPSPTLYTTDKRLIVHRRVTINVNRAFDLTKV